MVQSSIPYVQIDVNEFKRRLHPKSRTPVTLHFYPPSPRLYLSVIGLVINQLKPFGKIKPIPLQERLRKSKLAEVSDG